MLPRSESAQPGALFVTLFPYAIEAAMRTVAGSVNPSLIFSINQAAFGLVMILFLVFEPLGLVGIWRRLQTYFLLWPFKTKPLAGGRK